MAEHDNPVSKTAIQDVNGDSVMTNDVGKGAKIDSGRESFKNREEIRGVQEKIGQIERRLHMLKNEDLEMDSMTDAEYRRCMEKDELSIKDVIRLRTYEHISKLKSRLVVVEGEKEALLRKTEEAEEQFRKKDEENQNIKKEYTLLKVDVVHCQKELDRLRSSGDEVSRQKDKVTEEKNSKLHMITKLSKEIEELNSSLDELKESYKQVLTENKQLATKIENSEGRVKQMKNELSYANEKLVEARGILKAKDIECKKLRAHLKDKERSFNELVDKSSAALNKYETLSEKFLNKSGEFESTISKLKATREEIVMEMMKIVLNNDVDSQTMANALSYAHAIVSDDRSLPLEQLIEQAKEKRMRE